MSQNKRQKTEIVLRSDSQKKDSFDARVCDDLSEELLQYLPIEDKLRLESVSKQFRRTLFQKLTRISINEKWHKVSINLAQFTMTVDC